MAYNPSSVVDAFYASPVSASEHHPLSTPPPAMGGKYGGIDPALFAKMMRSFGGGAPGGGDPRAAAAQQMYGGGPGNISYAKKGLLSPELMTIIDIGTKVAPLL